MVNLKIIALILFLVQILSFSFYNGKHLLKWILPNTKIKVKWVNSRDRFVLMLSLCFIIVSLVLAKEIRIDNNKLSYFYSLIIFLMTIVMLLFHFKSFKVFQVKSSTNKTVRRKIIIRDKFELREITESELEVLIENKYKAYFSSGFEMFKYIFIDKKNSSGKLICVFKTERSKKYSYIKIFELMDELSENGILDLWDEERAKLIEFITKNFQLGDAIVIKDNLNSAYSRWLQKNR